MNPTEDDRQELMQAGMSAERLRTDPAFQRAVSEIRKNSVDALIALDATDTENNIRLRAEIKAIDALAGSIAMVIQRGTNLAKQQAN
jgi:hypothetical protein